MKTVSINSKVTVPSFSKFENLAKREKQQLLLAVSPVKLAKKWKMSYGDTCALLRFYGLNLVRARFVREKAEKIAKSAAPKMIKTWKVRPNTPFNKTSRSREEMRGLLFSMPVADLANKTGYTYSGILSNAKSARLNVPNGLYWRMVKEGWVKHVSGVYLPESVWRKKLNEGWKAKMSAVAVKIDSQFVVDHNKTPEKRDAVRTPGTLTVAANGDVIGLFMSNFCSRK